MHMFFSQTAPHSGAEHRNDPIVSFAYPPLASPTAARRAAWDWLWTRLLSPGKTQTQPPQDAASGQNAGSREGCATTFPVRRKLSRARHGASTKEVIAAAAARVAEGPEPDGDTYASAAYKRHVAGV